VLADPMHVVRVLGNFISNAAKYRTPGTPVIMRAEERADGFVRLSVRNQTQRPLSEAEQARVFDPFYRRPGEGAEGTGLGLTISREIAATHGGRIGVWASGEHVEFYLDLRVAPVSATNLLTKNFPPTTTIAR
jgi:signal transduction histidine kinase